MNQIKTRKQSIEIKRILVGVAGGSASGKTTLCMNIRQEVACDGSFNVLIIPLDCFYKDLDKSVNPKDYNFDHPDSLDFESAYDCLFKLLNGEVAAIPRYNFTTNSQEKEKDLVEPTEVILFEGILALYDERIRDLMQYMIYIHCDDDIRLSRRILRDVKERGRDVGGILNQYNRFVKRSFEDFIKPTMNYADLIVPGSRNNLVSVQFIVQHLKTKAKQIGAYKETVNQQIVFDGYVVESFEQSLFQQSSKKIDYSMTEDTFFKKSMVFPSSEHMKKDVNRQFSFFRDKFNYKQARSVFKNLTKTAISLWEKIKILHNSASSENVGSLDLEIFLNKRNEIDATKIQEYVIVVIPVLLPEMESQFIEASNWFLKSNPKIKLIFTALLSSLSTLVKLKNQCPNILHFINILCIGNRELFLKTINDNYTSGIEDPFFNPLFLHAQVLKRANKSLAKIAAKSDSVDKSGTQIE